MKEIIKEECDGNVLQLQDGRIIGAKGEAKNMLTEYKVIYW